MCAPSSPAQPPAPDDRRAALAAAMAAMVGDPAGVFGFLAEFGDDLRRVVRSILAGWGRRDLCRHADELDGLVFDVAMVIAERAGSWDPAGAPPWVWARRAIEAELARNAGHAGAPVDIEHLEGVLARAGPPAGEAQRAVTLDRLARARPELALLWAAIAEAVPDERNREVYTEFRLQKLLGDPSPAHTLAGPWSLSADNVRQIASRAHRRVRALVHAEDRYRTLRDARWFAT